MWEHSLYNLLNSSGIVWEVLIEIKKAWTLSEAENKFQFSIYQKKFSKIFQPVLLRLADGGIVWLKENRN